MGDLYIHKLLQRIPEKPLLEVEIEKVCQERLDRLKPLFKQIGFETFVKETPNLKFLDLECNDGTILFALKRRY